MYSLKDFGVTRETGELDDGSKVFLYRKPKMPLSTLVIFNAGSRHDYSGKDGLAHFSEHMLFKGTEKFKNEIEVSLLVEGIGGLVNAFTWQDGLGISADVGLVKDYPKVVDFIYELVKKSLFKEEKMEMERHTILSEMSDSLSNQSVYIYHLLQNNLYQGTILGRDIIGTAKSLKSISREDLYGFYTKNISSQKMKIIVAGDISVEELVDLYNKKFLGTKTQSGTKEIQSDLDIVRKKPVMIKVYEGSEHLYLGFGFRTCPFISRDTDVLTVIKSIISDGFSSSLYKKLRVDNGLVYFVDVTEDNFSDSGSFSVVTTTSKDKLQKVLDIITEEFNRLCSLGVTKEELKLAKDKIIKSKLRQMQQSNSWVEFHLTGDYLDPEGDNDLA
ncbi:MAG: pitrilysin family protein, partial [Patescibacteria group bacterium]